MKIPGLLCLVEKYTKRGYAGKVVEKLRQHGLAEYMYGSYWATIPSPILIEISRLLPRCVLNNRQNKSPSVGDFIAVAKKYRHTNLYFAVRVKSLDIGNVEDFVIEAIYIPLEEKELIEWAKTFWPDSMDLTNYKGQNFMYCWWD